MPAHSPLVILLEYTSLQYLLVTLVVSGLALILSIPEHYHPFSILRVVAIRMAERVHPDTGRSIFQQRLSGTLAPTIIILPIMVCIAIALSWAQYPLFFEALILFLSLRGKQILKTPKKIHRQLQQQKKLLAKHTLTPWVLRETDILSEMGIIKGTIESCHLRFIMEFITPALLFLLFGWWGALGYRFCFELHQCWNQKIFSFKHFGYLISAIIQLLTWLPFQLSTLLLIMMQGLTDHAKVLWSNRCARWRYLTLLALTMRTQLGGPVIYRGVKYRYPKVGTQTSPNLSHILLARQWVKMLMVAWSILFILISLIMYLIQKNFV